MGRRSRLLSVFGQLFSRDYREVSAKTGFKAFERIVDFRLVDKPFEVGDELTKLLKMKRHVISEKYKGLIDDIYE